MDNVANHNTDSLESLSALTRDLSGSGDAIELMHEHLEAARSSKLGAMRDEYLFNLKLAKQLLPEVDDPYMRERIHKFLRSVESEEHLALG